VLGNLRRVTFQSSETWFHRPLPVYWSDLGKAVGPVLVAGGIAGAVLWSGRLRTAPRVMLVVAWVVATFVFCSAIGLRHERYFMPAVPALAVLVGALAAADTYDLPYLRHHPAAARVIRLGVVVTIVASTAVSLRSTIDGLAGVARIGARSDTFYRQLAGVIRTAIPPEDRMMVSRPQTAYLAERNYYLSEYDVDGRALLAALAEPRNRITLIVQDSNQMLHPDMPAAEQQRFWEYVRQHFTVSQVLGGRAMMHRRTSW
jgi:4-amino-4-deoxy-L-arabinose transferase-like glycosyltransferase